MMRPVNKPACIYALVDPETEQIHYVGRTVGSLHDRLRAHLQTGKNLGKQRWLEKLKEKGLQPKIKSLDVITGGIEEIIKAEKDWIAKLLSQGEPLTNVQYAGPDGSWQLLPEQIERKRELVRNRKRV